VTSKEFYIGEKHPTLDLVLIAEFIEDNHVIREWLRPNGERWFTGGGAL